MAADRRFALTLLATTLAACGSASGGGAEPEQPGPYAKLRYDDGPPPDDPSNRVADDPLARTLGQRLYFDTSLSGPLLEGDHDGSGGTLGMRGEPGRVSCASCHVPTSGFVDTRSPHRQISLGSEWTRRRSPALLEVAFAPLFNWDGRRDSIWGQAMGVVESSREFNSSRLFVALRMFQSYRAEYEELFGPMPPLDDASRFPALAPENAGCVEVLTMSGSVHECRGVPGDGAEYDGMTVEDQEAVTRVAVGATKAIAAYVRQLRCGSARFDAFIDGDTSALDDAEQRGATLFVGKGKCVSCHSGPNLTDGKFHNIGLTPATVAVAFVDSDDRGAADAIEALRTDPLATNGAFSDGDRHALPAETGPELVGAFRTPSLRCISSHPSFLHTGQLATLSQVVSFHDRGGDAPGRYPGEGELESLGLTEGERADLVAFLKALDGAGPPSELLEPLP